MSRPNILFAFADDWGRYASIYQSIHGDRSLSAAITTPTIDRIAREGALFTNAVVPAPTCTPCRSSLLSGRYFWQTRLGAILQGAVWDDAIPTYPRILEAAGYHTGATYKTWGPGVSAGVPPCGTHDHYYNEAGQEFSGFSHVATQRVADGETVEQAKAHLYDEVLGNFTDFMNARGDDQPFCYWWGPTNTHRTWEKGSGKALWGLEPEDLTGRLPHFFPDVPEVREDVADYLGECMAYDRGLAVIVEALEKRGELDNTLIVVSGDHGIPGFPRAKCNLYDIGCEVALMARLPGTIAAGQVIEEMTNIMDLAPTFLEAAGCDPEPSMTATSLWPRLTGTTSLPKENFVITGRERHVATAREWNLPYPQRAIRTQDFLYIHNFEPDRWPMGDPKGMDDLSAPPIPWEAIERDTRSVYADLDAGPTKAWMIHHRAEPEHTQNFLLGFDKRPQEELFDLRTDPHQMTNVAGDPAYEETRKELHDTLMAELRRQHDPRVCDTVCRYEASPFTDVLDHGGPEVQAQAKERLSRSGA
ncbi:MAG: sulfatase family protein [Planctomycetota bacterium]|jgi:arylsulfatase A-like enzyme